MSMEFYVKRPDCNLYCRAEGNGPLLLLIHGVACDCDYFAETAKLLARKYTVVTYDRRGYSRSTILNVRLNDTKGANTHQPAAEGMEADDSEINNANTEKAVGNISRDSLNDMQKCQNEADYTLQVQVEDAAAVIRQMNKGAAYVVGSSAGAVISAALALHYPELVKTLVLHEPVFADDPDTQESLCELTEKIIRCRNEKRGISKALLAFVETMGGTDKRAIRKSLPEQAQALKNLQVFVDCEVETLMKLSVNELKGIRCPVYVAAGECDGNGLFCRGAKSAAGLLGWPLLHVPGYHNMASDLPVDFAVMVFGALALAEMDFKDEHC